MALNDKVSFLKSLPYFARWTKVSLAKLSYFFHEMTLNRNQFAYRQDEPSARVYLIREGEFEMSKKI